MNHDEELERLGAMIKKARIRIKLSQTKLAHSIGKDQPSINRVERGKINPSYLYLVELARGLKISLSELLNQ